MRITLGRITRPVGIRGELRFLPAEDFWPATLGSRGLSLYLAGKRRSVDVVGSRQAGQMLALKLKGIEDRNAAEQWRDADLVLELDELDIEPPSTTRPFQILGFLVEDTSGRKLGKVVALAASAAQPLLTVEGETASFDIPFVEPLVQRLDTEAELIVVDPPEGLLDL